MTKPDSDKLEQLDENEKQKAVDYGISGMADGSSLVISVAVGLLGILALYQFSDLEFIGWFFLSVAYWLVFMFGLFIFAFHQANALAVWRYTSTMKTYKNYSDYLRLLSNNLWFTRIAIDLTASDFKETLNSNLNKKEKIFANLTVVFYFLVALMLWLAIAVFTEKYMEMLRIK